MVAAVHLKLPLLLRTAVTPCFYQTVEVSDPSLVLELLWGLQGEGCAWGEATGRASGSYSDRPMRVLTKNSLETINLIERNGMAKLPGTGHGGEGRV